MSGHSKWATTKHKKAVIDARRGKLFAKLIKNIEVAARIGGGDLGGQPDPVRRHPEGQEDLGPERQHRSGRQAGLRGRGRRRGLRDADVRGVRAGRRRAADRMPDRQPQPLGVRGPGGRHPERRHHGRRGLDGADVQPQGRGDRGQAAGRPDHHRGRPARGDPGCRPRGDQRPRRHLRDHQRPEQHRSGADRGPGRRSGLRIGRGVLRPGVRGGGGRGRPSRR